MKDVLDTGLQVTTLMNEVKFRRFFDHIGLTNEARIKANNAIIKAIEAQKTCITVSKGFTNTMEEEEHKISFSKVDREAKYPHNRSLHIIAKVNDIEM